MCTAAVSPFTNRACQLATQDLQAARKEYVFTLPGSVLTTVTGSGLLRDNRDLPLLLLLFNITITTVPAAMMLHLLRNESHLIGLAYLLANYVLYLQASCRTIVAACSTFKRMAAACTVMLLSTAFHLGKCSHETPQRPAALRASRCNKMSGYLLCRLNSKTPNTEQRSSVDAINWWCLLSVCVSAEVHADPSLL